MYSFYIDSLEVFAIQKWEDLKINQKKKIKINKIQFEFN